MNILGKRSDLPFSRKSDRKKEKSVVSFTHEQNSICSQKQLNAWAHHYLQAVICRSHGGLSANEKEETFASNDKSIYLHFHYLFGFGFGFSINSPILRNIQPPPWKNTTHFCFVPSTIFCLGLYRRTGTWAILKSSIWSEGSSDTFWRRLKALWIWRILFITLPMPSNDARYAFKKLKI